MAKKQAAQRVAVQKTSKALVLHEIALSQRADIIVRAETPAALIKSKPGRGGKRVTYVEGGYVINQLNAAFSPLGWEFEIVEQGTTERKNEKSSEGEVWVRGKLTIIDHAKGWRVSKMQYGQHPIHEKVPIGDAYKAAGTDALKKCASMIGIALDVYWGQLDAPEDNKPKEPNKDELFERAKLMVASSKNMDALLEYQEKLANEKGKLSDAQRKDMVALVKKRIDEIQNA